MPHLVIEYSKQGHADLLDLTALMEALHDAAAATGIMKSEDIKVRAMSYDHSLVARSADGFCHLSVYLLKGRSPEQKITLSETLRSVMIAMLPQTKSLSVDIRDMNADAYRKRLNDERVIPQEMVSAQARH